ncbi:MAG: NAD(P)H-dependent oxidoreductase subunit E [Syntrophaceae bacterium]|nr:NAD(P)H-dependent oxidoreductase subunit E [Syntrophaceae bacterium]
MDHHVSIEDGLKSLEAFISASEKNDTALIKVLYEAQRTFGYLPREAVFFIGEQLNVPVSKIYGIISFYSYFTTEPKGRYQCKLCMGTACFVRGADKVARELESQLGIKMGETTEDKQFSLEGLRCVGACGLAPVLLVNEEVFGKVGVEDMSKIIAQHQE